MQQPTAAMIVIGDEILSGRTRDINANVLAKALTEHGISLREVRFIPDEADTITQTVRDFSERFDHVFTSGGIGPTHDDITADCVAAAFSVPIDVREDARAILATNYEDPERDLNEARLRMARIPETAILIDNPISKAPGFTLENVHVMAGVPNIFETMLASLLPTLTGGPPLLSETINIERPEGELAGPLGIFAADNPALSIGCYPYNRNGQFGCNVVVRGTDNNEVAAAAATLSLLLSQTQSPH